MTLATSPLDEINGKKIIDAMAESIWIGDANERTVYANPNFCNLIGCSLEEMIWRLSYEFWDEESVRTVQANNVVRKHGWASKYEWVLKSKDGVLIPVLVSGTPLANWGTAGIITDLREIRAVREEAERLQYLSNMKDEFISMVGHELRTPMTGIRGYLSMILDEDAGPITPQTRKFLQTVYNESERLINMINDMLDIAKLEADKMEFHEERVNINEMAREISDELLFVAKDRELKLESVCDAQIENKRILADRSKLKQVIINLVGNALKFTPKGGSVTLKTSLGMDGLMLFEVIDTGIGIPKDQQKKVFEKFAQVNNYMQKSIAGTGLGLYICKKILSHFGSELFVISKEGEGSDFYFRIPLAK